MKTFLNTAAVILGMAIMALSQAQRPAPACALDDKACHEIDRLEVEWNLINELSDPDGKARMLAFDSYHVGPSGRLYDKPADIAAAKQAYTQRGRYENVKFFISGKKIRLFKEAAVVTGYGSSIVTEGGTKRAGRPFRFVHVWEKREGVWYLIVDQVTGTSDQTTLKGDRICEF